VDDPNGGADPDVGLTSRSGQAPADAPDLAGRRRAQLAGGVAAAALALFLVGWIRPMDVALLSSTTEVLLAGLVGFGGVVALGALLRGSEVVRPLAFLLGGVGLVLITCLGVIVVALGGGGTSETTVSIPETDLEMGVVSHDGSLGGEEVVLLGSIGPLPRRRVVVDVSGNCSATLRPVGPRTIEAVVVETTEGCGDVGRGGTYRIEVGTDGWTTSVERVPDE